MPVAPLDPLRTPFSVMEARNLLWMAQTPRGRAVCRCAATHTVHIDRAPPSRPSPSPHAPPARVRHRRGKTASKRVAAAAPAAALEQAAPTAAAECLANEDIAEAIVAHVSDRASLGALVLLNKLWRHRACMKYISLVPADSMLCDAAGPCADYERLFRSSKLYLRSVGAIVEKARLGLNSALEKGWSPVCLSMDSCGSSACNTFLSALHSDGARAPPLLPSDVRLHSCNIDSETLPNLGRLIQDGVGKKLVTLSLVSLGCPYGRLMYNLWETERGDAAALLSLDSNALLSLLDAFKQSPPLLLKSMDLSSNSICGAGLDGLAAAACDASLFPSLRSIALSNNYIDCCWAAFFEAIEKGCFPKLKEVHVGGNDIAHDSDLEGTLNALRSDRFPSLDSLCISAGERLLRCLAVDCVASPSRLAMRNSYTSNLGCLSALTAAGRGDGLGFRAWAVCDLELQHNNVDCRGAYVLATAIRDGGLPNLVALNMMHNPIGWQGAKHLIVAPPQDRPLRLNLSANFALCSSRLGALVPAPALGAAGHVVDLSLVQCDIGDVQLDTLLACLPGLPLLDDLRLGYNPIGPAGAAKLADRLSMQTPCGETVHLPRLRGLHMQSCILGAEGLGHIFERSHLGVFRVRERCVRARASRAQRAAH